MDATYPSGVQLTDLHERRPLCRDCDNKIMKEKRIRKKKVVTDFVFCVIHHRRIRWRGLALSNKKKRTEFSGKNK